MCKKSGHKVFITFYIPVPSFFFQIFLKLILIDSIVSGNSLEPKNVFLRQKTPEFFMIYWEKILDFFRFFCRKSFITLA